MNERGEERREAGGAEGRGGHYNALSRSTMAKADAGIGRTTGVGRLRRRMSERRRPSSGSPPHGTNQRGRAAPASSGIRHGSPPHKVSVSPSLPPLSSVRPSTLAPPRPPASV